MILHFLFTALSLLIVSYIVPGVHVASIWSALAAALILGLVNILVKPIIFLLTLPLTIITFGLFSLVVNGLMLLLVSSIVKGFTVDSLWSGMLAALVMWILSLIWFALRGGKQQSEA